ncbi:MAG TPA: HAMP domain-containing sensor histidine kinase, partial [Steroidobacteraceae bacterium]|nr:HAMP domain-containing sensor histidine kinase [Steroidobacteraceae bacterium]
LSSLLLIGLLLLVVPLALAVLQASTQLGRLAQDTDRLVRQGVELSGRTQALFRYLIAYERSANLYLLLNDPRLLEATRATREQIAETTEGLAGLPMPEDGPDRLSALRRATPAVLGLLEFTLPNDPDRASRLAERLDQLNEAANAVSAGANQALEAQLAALERRAADTRRQLFLWLVALVPAFLAMGLAFAVSVLRPLRRVDRAITELGRGTFSSPIAITGPSDIEALGRQLEWLRVRLLELAQEKNRFLRHMSHELKTPLANIREGTELLLDGAVGQIDAQQREVADIMRENSLRLQQLIENLLSYSAWQSQVSGLELSDFTLGSVVAGAFRAQRLTITSRRIKAKLEIEHLVLHADQAKIRLVLDNLLANALKFTPEGGTITVRARRLASGIVIDFADTGPGVHPRDRERIFEAFYTGTTPQAGPLKGSGIGLSIVAEFVAAHEGRVELVSGEFPGAHFRIHLPLSVLVERPDESRAHA